MTNKLYQELEQAARMTGAAKDTILENALSRYLAELKEDAEDAVCAEKAWNDFEKSGEKTYTIAEMRHEESAKKFPNRRPDILKQSNFYMSPAFDEPLEDFKEYM